MQLSSDRPVTEVACGDWLLGEQPEEDTVDECLRQGLPVTTAWMESLVKEVNYRVKGTEMF